MEADGIGQPSLGHPNPTMPSIDHRLIDQIINRTHTTPNPPSKKTKTKTKQQVVQEFLSQRVPLPQLFLALDQVRRLFPFY